MRLRDLADGFAALEATASRGKLVTLVADLLLRAGPRDVEPLVHLLRGELAAPHEGIEIGIGERLLIGILASAYGLSEAAVSRRLRYLGDLGRVAEELASSPRRPGLTVQAAFHLLLGIAKTTGIGSVGRKTAAFAGALRRSGPREALVLVRAAQGRLRLGVGDQTILEAIALAALGDRKDKARVEAAFNVRSDLASVARIALEKGGRGLARIGPVPGIPIRPALAQRLPSAEAIIRRLGTVRAEPKYDGLRLQLHRDGEKVWAFSRRLENVTPMFPELTAALRRQLRLRRAIIEGEAVVHNPETGEYLPFQVTMTRKRKTGIAEAAERYPLRLFAFDLLLAGRRDLLSTPQAGRSRRLGAAIRPVAGGAIAVTESLTTSDPRELGEYFDEMIHRGLEGVVVKRPDAPYRAGARGFDWVKLKRSYHVKLRDTVDLVLVGYLRGRGKRAGLGIGSLLAAVYDPAGDRFRTVAKIGSGLTEAEWRRLRRLLDAAAAKRRPARVDSLVTPDVWVDPGLVVEVLADEITRSPAHTCGRRGGEPGYALRFPRIVGGIRADKSVSDATTEQEILELFRLQRRAPPRRRPRRA